jgi:hypothetical protein
MKCKKPINILGFSGIAKNFSELYFTSLVTIKVVKHISQVSYKVGPLEQVLI